MDILLTLGHNSSALTVDGNYVIGYEEERFTRKKSDSSYPINSINNILTTLNRDITDIKNVYVTHWFDNDAFLTTSSKYYNPNHIKNANVITLSNKFTHHDAHAWSVINFFETHANVSNYFNEDIFIFVFDGFGNNQEVISVYKLKYLSQNDLSISLIERVYGYKKSLGLLYQYATSFCGMKENQDEYKFLGYESHFLECFSITNLSSVLKEVEIFVKRWEQTNLRLRKRNNIDKNVFIDIDYLHTTKRYFYNVFDVLCKKIGVSDNDVFRKRVLIGFFVQLIIETILVSYIRKYNVKKLLLNGGLFFNVKLNNRLLNEVTDFICVNPLAGDQGCAIGLYRRYKKPVNVSGLCFGYRKDNLVLKREYNNKYFNIVKTKDELIENIINILHSNEVVNVVCGNMEFGPRALCNTSTLAIPSKKNVDIINMANGRNTVMPMAPVILYDNINKFFDSAEYLKVIGSDRYMIITYNYKHTQNLIEKYLGVMHNHPLYRDVYSGRPQVVYSSSQHYIVDVLKRCGVDCLINTSYNIHGRPIVFDIEHAINDLEFQLKQLKNINKKIPLIVYQEND